MTEKIKLNIDFSLFRFSFIIIEIEKILIEFAARSLSIVFTIYRSVNFLFIR